MAKKTQAELDKMAHQAGFAVGPKAELPDIRDSIVDEETGEILATAYKPPFWKTPFNHDTDQESARTSTGGFEPTKTQQHQAKEADINYIVETFLKTGELPAMKTWTDQEFTETDLQEALNIINAARAQFDALPPAARNAFQGDPQKMVAYIDHCMSTGDLSPLVPLGLANPEADPELPFEDRVANAIARVTRAEAPKGGTPASDGGKTA